MKITVPVYHLNQDAEPEKIGDIIWDRETVRGDPPGNTLELIIRGPVWLPRRRLFVCRQRAGKVCAEPAVDVSRLVLLVRETSRARGRVQRAISCQKNCRPTMKPIESWYKGHRFRSRLEARWAVFFDALQFRWEYEPQGYVLPNTGCYLPDFKVILPNEEIIYCEINHGEADDFDDDEVRKLRFEHGESPWGRKT
jgi:hypothetical protein